ncbi:olfactory receptor 14A16-like [Eublepharis macularius]|uniref:Olfactory receptor n=1 Tax=Eublepharis macularius TaxID=481883 RepID=A0AA97LF64_EUBMA|nr:olfactory receptor 14A16-like [Eublepharis macularius]
MHERAQFLSSSGSRSLEHSVRQAKKRWCKSHTSSHFNEDSDSTEFSDTTEDMSNISIITDFLLLGFSDVQELQVLHFVCFLGVYLAIFMGNFLIIALIALNTHLHTPMYFFLVNLSIIDLGSISITLPRSMANDLMNRTQILYSECVAQVFFFTSFLSTNVFLLTVMAYDRYTAICQPLHYSSLMGKRACFEKASGAWTAGFLNAAIQTWATFSTPFCSHTVHQFCEIPQLLRMSCSGFNFNEYAAIVFTSLFGFGCFVFIIASYVKIFSTVLRMPSLEGRQKAFSTCLPHLAVVSLFFCSAFFAYLLPTSSIDQKFTVIYTILPPMLNPVIYSMRNKDVKTALWKLFDGNFLTGSQNFHF